VKAVRGETPVRAEMKRLPLAESGCC
jgi:hypothetical protein